MSSNFNIEESDTLKEIVKVTDEDFNLSPVYHKEKTTIRLGSRGIVLNDKGEIAVIYKKAKNEYKLPGGGIDSGEKAQEAFRRECEEELGCVVDITKELGTAIEYKSQENFRQLAFVYEARKVDELESNNLTEKEKAEGAEYIWLPKLQALKKMRESLEKLESSDYDSVYRTRFMVLRDVRILEYYINNV